MPPGPGLLQGFQAGGGGTQGTAEEVSILILMLGKIIISATFTSTSTSTIVLQNIKYKIAKFYVKPETRRGCTEYDARLEDILES